MSASIPKELRDKVAAQAKDRCGYCLTTEEITGVLMPLDHLVPKAHGGLTVEENLWLACTPCNSHKSDRLGATDPETGAFLPLFDPRRDRWTDHFRWSQEQDLIIGLTAVGRATVKALQLNRSELVASRQVWVAAGLHPPKD